MKTINELEQEAKQAREDAGKACEGVDPKIVDLIGKVIHAAFLQYTMGMMQQRKSNEERVAKELFGDGSGESLPEVSQEERDSDGFIKWDGGDCPVGQYDRVDYELRDGTIYYNSRASVLEWRKDIVERSWDIVAYKVAK